MTINIQIQKRVFYTMLSMLVILGFVISSVQAQTSFVTSIAWSSDGTRVASAGNDNSIVVHDTLSKRILYELRGHTGFILMLAWSPDNRMIATASEDQTIRVWSASDGTLLQTLIGHNEAVMSVTWSSDSTKLLSSGYDIQPLLFVWDVQSGKVLSTHHAGSIADAAFSPDGLRFAYSSSLALHILDSLSFEVIAQSPYANCCSNQMRSIAWSPDSRTIVTGSINGLVTLWDASSAQMIKQFVANSHYAPDSLEIDNTFLSRVRDVAFGPNGHTVLAISGDGTLREWDVKTEKLVQDMQIGSLYTATWSAYTGQLAILEPDAQNDISLNSAESFDASEMTGIFHIVVPAPSPELLDSIEAACVPTKTISKLPAAEALATNTTTTEAYVLAVRTAPAISSACAGDLIAVAEALQTEQESR